MPSDFWRCLKGGKKGGNYIINGRVEEGRQREEREKEGGREEGVEQGIC